MNVLGVMRRYVPHSRVGAWITTHEFLAELARRGHSVTVVAFGSEVDTYEHDGITVHRNGADVERPHVIVSHTGDDNAGARFAYSLGVPSVRFVHGAHSMALNALGCGPSALAVFSSQALADWVGWDGPTLIAHPPIRPADYRVKPGAHVTLVNLSDLKGGWVLRDVALKLPSIKFLGVRGWGEQITDQPANVTIIDPVEDMRAVYRKTRVLLMPSANESYGRVGVEAACSGIPTIAHPSPGLVEALGDAATWVDRGDTGGWVAAVDHLTTLDGWKDASRAARLAIPTDADATIARVADAIEEVARCA